MRILHVVGTRPNFVKMAPVIAAPAASASAPTRHVVVHTGQHYDRLMSDVFFEELGVPEPDHMLGVGSGTHARADGAGARAARAGACATSARPGARPRRRQLDPRGRALRRQARDPGRPRRVGAAQLRPHDARGDQPRGHRPPLRAPLPALRRGRSRTSRAEGIADERHALRRQHDDRHAGRARGPRFANAAAAARARARAGRLPARHPAPAGARRRPAARRGDGGARGGRGGDAGRLPGPPADAQDARPSSGARRRASR